MKMPGFRDGAWVGILLAAIAGTVLHLGERLLGLPFVPFDAFDWFARALPGGVVTVGIDALVMAIEALGAGPTSVVAKRVEQASALIGFLAAGGIAGGFGFALMRRAGRDRSSCLVGLAVGGCAALAAAVVSLAMYGGPAPVLLAGVWVMAVGLAFGVALAWCRERLLAEARVTTAPEAEAEAVDRRTFLVRLGGATAAVTVVGAVVGSLRTRQSAHEAALAEGARPWSETNPLPNADALPEPVPGTRPELTPVAQHYRIDINTRPIVIDPEAWRLRVVGLVDAPAELSLADLRGFEPMHQFVTLECISNRVAGDLISTTRWTGVSLSALLPRLGLRTEATHLRLVSADGFHEAVPLDLIRQDPRVMLCYDWDGLPLPPEHGFPLRVYIPDVYGMKQPKWIETIEAIRDWRPGYWVERSWSREARIQASAVIDAVATDLARPGEGGTTVVPVGGIAFAGARGISRVEVRVDNGDWRPAELREPLSDTTWVIWRYDWPFEPGEHTLTVRCFDGRGQPQVTEPSTPHPEGATGLHTTSVRI